MSEHTHDLGVGRRLSENCPACDPRQPISIRDMAGVYAGMETVEDPTRALADKVIRLAKANAILARAGGRGTEERRWLDLIHAIEADAAQWD